MRRDVHGLGSAFIPKGISHPGFVIWYINTSLISDSQPSLWAPSATVEHIESSLENSSGVTAVLFLNISRGRESWKGDNAIDHFLLSPHRRLTGPDRDTALCSWWWIRQWSRGWRKEAEGANLKNEMWGGFTNVGENATTNNGQHRNLKIGVLLYLCMCVLQSPPISVPVIDFHFYCPVRKKKRFLVHICIIKKPPFQMSLNCR